MPRNLGANMIVKKLHITVTALIGALLLATTSLTSSGAWADAGVPDVEDSVPLVCEREVDAFFAEQRVRERLIAE